MQDLDDAVMDRIDETVGFPKPGMAEREKMLRKYFRVYLGRVPTETESVRFGPLGLWDVTVDPYTAAIPDCGEMFESNGELSLLHVAGALEWLLRLLLHTCCGCFSAYCGCYWGCRAPRSA